MPVTANYYAAQFRLWILAQSDPDTIVVSRNAAGTLLVNSGAVPITGGPASVSNTDIIEVGAGIGNDIVSLDETFGALPSAELYGGDGDDMLTGGSSGDIIAGEIGNDILFGRGGNDILYGGIGDDILTGGDGDDQMFGEDGNDRMIWNSGDDSDLMEGGNGTDIAQLNAGNGSEVFTVTANGTRVRFDRLSPAPFVLDIGTTESLVVNMNGGDDTFSSSGNIAALIAVTVDGGAGNDTILGSNGMDTLFGGDGNDFIDGNQGSDIAFLGAGDDIFQWDPGDGSDIVEGQDGIDTLLFNLSNANEIINLSANGGRTLLTRNIGSVVMDLNDVEAFTINALGGIDAVTIGDLSGTDAATVSINLAATLGGASGDGAADSIFLSGSAAANPITVSGSGTSVTVTGLPGMVSISNSDGASDSLTINALGGDDIITATALAAGIIQLTIDGGAGNDTIMGSQSGETLLGGDGNDVVFGDNGNDIAFLGAGDDVFEWSPGDGNDVVEGQAGFDELRFNGSNATETVNILPNGGRILLVRDVAAVTMDLDDVERIRFDAIGGADTIVVDNLTGTDAVNVDIHLEGPVGGGDAASDSVSFNATNVGDSLTVSSTGGVVSVAGMPWTLSVFGAEVANDTLTVNAFGGDDTIDASALASGLIALNVNAGLGNDLFIGSAGADMFLGGDGNDTALLGAGNDIAVWNPGDDNDVIEGQGGIDTLRFTGANVSETITISPNGGRTTFFRDIAAVTIDLNDVEVIQYFALGGADTITVGDLSGTEVTTLAIDLASTIGGSSGDLATDTLVLNASDGNNTINLVSATAALVTVTGLPATATIAQFEVGQDRLTVLGLGGNDSISATGLAFSTNKLTIDGGAGNDILRSNGDGTYLGGTGDDTIYAGLTNSSEVIDGGDGIDTLDTTSFSGTYTVNMVTGATNYTSESFLNFENLVTGAGNDTVTGTAVDNMIFTNAGNDTISGGDGADLLDGGPGHDFLDGGTGADVLKGGPGNDVYYVDNAGDVVTENAGEGTDEVRTTLASYTLTANVENLTGLLATGQTLIGNSLANAIHGGAGHDVLNGGSGDDVMVGGPGDDTYYVGETGDVVVELAGEGSDRIFSKVSYVLPDNVETLQLQLAGLTGTGNALANTLIGSSGADVLRGMGGADLINAADGNDTLEGGADNDTLYGGLGNDVLDGGTGADTMYGQQGDDLYYVDDAGDVVIEGVGEGTDEVRTALASYTLTPNVENLTGTSAGGQALTGNTLANTILGNAGNDVLNGGGGADTMKGALGNDVYYVDDVGDVVSELLGQGTDEVRTTLASYTLANNVENLTGLSGGVQTLAGNGLDNVITGSTNNDVLNGNGGNDTLKGGLGNDTYYVQQVGDVVVELAGEGVDKVLTKVDYTLPDNVEILQLQLAGLTGTGNALDNYMVGTTGSDVLYGMDGVDSIVAQDGNDTVYGGNGNDQIWGGGGNDFIDGGEGADKMAGQLGNDVYVVDDAGDVVIEGVGEGTDEVRTALAAYSLTANVENLTGTSAGGQALTGNTLANIILGNAGNDVLNGGGGADTMKGALGNDVYYVDLAGDVVVENAGEGTDKILAKVSYTLPANVEILQLQLGGLTGTGNGLDNTLTGSTGNDILRGLGGADTMAGGDGADTLEGGADNDALYGGNGNDVLDGGAGDDSLNGGADNDTLKGGAGKDSLFGGTGADTFAFGPGDSAAAWGSADTILDFVSGTDRIDLGLIDANTTGGAPGDQAFTFIGNAAFSNVAGQLHYVQSGGSTYIEGDTNGDAIADFTIQLTGTLNPVVADFML